MSKLFAILFSALILVQSSNIGFDDVSKLNVLLEHAKFHQETYGDSFFEFLAEHYGEDMQQHQSEHEEHEELPFKHKQDCSKIYHDFTKNTLFKINNKLQDFSKIPLNFYYKEIFSLFEKPSVFQPPQLA